MRAVKKVVSRRNDIVHLLEQENYLPLVELSKKLDCSVSTIKRDLNELESEGLLQRTHGGVYLRAELEAEKEQVPIYRTRLTINAEQKQRIAKYAAGLIQDGDLVFLDLGSTISNMVKYITAQNVRIFTNSCGVLSEAMACRNDLDVYVFSGKLDYSLQGIVGQQLLDELSEYVFTKSFFSCNYINTTVGGNSLRYSERARKYKLIENSQKTILCADSAKIGERKVMIPVTFDKLDCVITDNGICDEYAAQLRTNPCEIVIV